MSELKSDHEKPHLITTCADNESTVWICRDESEAHDISGSQHALDHIKREWAEVEATGTLKAKIKTRCQLECCD